MPAPAIYVRQSINHPEGIDRSLARCRELVSARGWPEAVEFSDNAVSASRVRDESTAWGQLLGRIRAGEFDTVVGVDLDRLVRSIRDLTALTDLGVKVLTVDGEIDLTTADGEFRATMLAGIARFETRRKGERQKRGNEWRSAQGLPVPGRPRYGFLPGNVEEHPEEAPQVRALFEGIAAGDSLTSWASKLGMPTVQVRRMLLNPAYAGYVIHKGAAIEAHESVARIVDRELWQAVQVIVKDPARKVSPGNQVASLLSGIARCGTCDKGLVRNRLSYRCPASGGTHPNIRIGVLDAYVKQAVLPTLGYWRDHQGDEARVAAARQRVEELDAQIASGVDLALALTGAGQARVRAHLVALEAEKEAAVAELSRALADNLPLTDLITAHNDEAMHTSFSAEGFEEGWEALGFDRQRELIRRLFRTIEVHPGRDTTERVHLYPWTFPHNPDAPIPAELRE